MGELLVVFASLNQVALLKRALYRLGVFVEMQRTPHCLASTGCGFALLIPPEQRAAVERECRALSIAHGGVYQKSAEGKWIAL